MKGCLALIFCCMLSRVFAETPLGVPGSISENDKESVDSILGLLSCLDDPQCLPPITKPVAPEEKAIRFRIENYDSSLSDEEYLALFQQHLAQRLVVFDLEEKPLDTSMPKPPTPYFTLCEKLHLKLEELEHEHPELKDLKLELLERFDKYSAQFKGQIKSGENVVIKVLEMILVVVEELKKDFAAKVPCPVIDEGKEVIEIIAEEDEAPYIGSVRGIPGINYPNYTEVPITSFSCQDKHIPGFYADLETGCQVFHVCYEHRRESFLCPLGTIFNQPILACDYWYSVNCSLAPNYYEKIEEPVTTEEPVAKEPVEIIEKIETKTDLKTLVPFIPVTAKVVEYPKKPEGKPIVSVLTGIEEVASKIFGEVVAKQLAELQTKVKKPVDEKVADKVFEGVVTSGLKVTTKTRQAIKVLPKPVPGFVKVVKPHPVAKTAAIKAKFAAKAAVPVAKTILAAAKVPLLKTAAAAAVKVPIVKAKAAGAAAAAVKIPFLKGKVVGAAATAAKLPIVKAKFATAAVKVPVVKAKAVAASAAAIKAKTAAASAAAIKAKAASAAAVKAKKVAVAVPVAKAKIFKAAAVPFFKVKAAAVPLAKVKLAAIPAIKAKKVVRVAPLVKMAALPVVKAKLVGSSAIAPMTKKALALGYLKLLKAKKLVMMG